MAPKCLTLDPIGVLDWMGNVTDGPAYSPFGYGYTNYSRDGYCSYPLVFADAPGIGVDDPRGTVIGGTGIAVSASSEYKDIAVDYAFWIAGAQCQLACFLMQADNQRMPKRGKTSNVMLPPEIFSAIRAVL